MFLVHQQDFVFMFEKRYFSENEKSVACEGNCAAAGAPVLFRETQADRTGARTPSGVAKKLVAEQFRDSGALKSFKHLAFSALVNDKHS